jgi:hypothetical protein
MNVAVHDYVDASEFGYEAVGLVEGILPPVL